MTTQPDTVQSKDPSVLLAELKALRTQLSALHAEKEKLFSEKEQASQKIRALIGDVKTMKGARNSLTDDVSTLKEERKKLNQEIRTKVEEVKKLREAAKKVQTKTQAPPSSHGGHGRFDRRDKPLTPSRIREQITKLEYTQETEALSFEKEQKLNKQLKELRKQLGEFESVSLDWSKINAMSKEIDELKKRADEIHGKIQNEAKQSQDKHEQVLAQSKDIDGLKAEEDRLQKEFKKKKKEHTKVAEQVKELQTKLQGVREAEDTLKQISRAEGHAKQMMRLADKRREVEAKVQRGEKLTTEDILVMQGAE